MTNQSAIIHGDQRNDVGHSLTNLIKGFGPAGVGKGLPIHLANPGQILLVLCLTNFNHWAIGRISFWSFVRSTA